MDLPYETYYLPLLYLLGIQQYPGTVSNPGERRILKKKYPVNTTYNNSNLEAVLNQSCVLFFFLTTLLLHFSLFFNLSFPFNIFFTQTISGLITYRSKQCWFKSVCANDLGLRQKGGRYKFQILKMFIHLGEFQSQVGQVKTL